MVPEVLYVAKKAGVTHILQAGGAQAVAAMGYGTQTCPKVDKIFGPGNQFVTAAKMTLQNSEAMVSIDMPAGPSEVLVVADKDAPQPRRGGSPFPGGARTRLPGGSRGHAGRGSGRHHRRGVPQAAALPRSEITAKALGHSYAVVVKDLAEACAFSNAYAPEHLIVNVEDAERLLPTWTTRDPSFSEGTPPSRWATTRAAPTTCFPRTGTRACTAASRWTRS